MAWGDNEFGELGDGSTTDSDEPVEVGGLSGVVAVSAGSASSYALLENGTVMAWGANDRGQLGDEPSREGKTNRVTGPELCESPELEGWLFGCARTPVEVVDLSEVAAISGGGSHVLALLQNHTVVAWGSNIYGQLGLNDGEKLFPGPESCSIPFSPSSCSAKPVPVTGLSEFTVVAVAAGAQHSLALLSNGHVMAWGENNSGQLGDGHSGAGSNEYAPVEVHGLTDATAIAGGDANSDALLAGGTVMEWGEGVDEPAEVNNLTEVAGIAAGGFALAYGAPGPIVSRVEPNSGAPTGGTSVKIQGSEFTKSMTLRFGEVVVGFEYISSTEVIAKSPEQKPGTVNITAEHNGRSDPGSASEFTYVPENIDFGRCAKVGAGTGRYKTNTCTEAVSGGSYEWTPGAEKGKFTSADSTETVEREVEGKMEKIVQPKKVVFETTGKEELVCKNESGSGEYTGKDAVTNFVVAFSGCEFGGVKCASPGAVEGEMVTSTLEGLLGWREREGNKVALDLKPAGEEPQIIEATCGSASVKLRGRVIAAITSVNKMESTFTLSFDQTNGKQAIEALEEEKEKEVLEMSISTVGFGLYVQTGLKLGSKLTNEESIEINTVA